MTRVLGPPQLGGQPELLPGPLGRGGAGPTGPVQVPKGSGAAGPRATLGTGRSAAAAAAFHLGTFLLSPCSLKRYSNT